ncbi:hypothetical protein PIB30_028202 [Stylosanthes scabra]|uniref:RRM domain-containing protein n=1 Tax=Stylosanthes scabra TaxID=79078 RepID=A0ABU6SBD4_9FABA|nr:hypothetical protein [Stylosanthes scabra]
MEEEGPNFVPGLYVDFVPPTMETDQLKEHFAQYGEITDSVIINHDDTGTRNGYAFVTFKDPSSVDKAIKDNDHLINHHLLRVAKTRSKVRSRDQDDYKTNRLYFYLLPKNVSSDAVSTFFGEYGKVISCRIQRGTHYGYVYFQSDQTADDILAAYGNWINFRGRFMLEISKHKLQKYLDNANREGGHSAAQIPHRTAAHSPAGENTSSGRRDGNNRAVQNQLWQPYGSHGNVYGGGGGAMVPSVALPNSIGYGCYYPPTMSVPQYGIPSHYGYGGASMGYGNATGYAGRYGGQNVVGRAGVSTQGASGSGTGYTGHYGGQNVVSSAGVYQEARGSRGPLNASSQVDDSNSLFSYPMVTQGASGSGGSSNANQDDNSNSLFSYEMVTQGASGSGGVSNASQDDNPESLFSFFISNCQKRL